ncbi:hypothetical protein K474DRAFT_1712329 [Panus rudis PR-1116 ss-1]|nr:hypothetical protein K474DRAFT_1712329 [Panus rudis PR-1116 ss-1]
MGNPTVDGALRSRLAPGSMLVPQSYGDVLDVEDCSHLVPPVVARGSAVDADVEKEDGKEHTKEDDKDGDNAQVPSPPVQLRAPLSAMPSPLSDWTPSDDEENLDSIAEMEEEG